MSDLQAALMQYAIESGEIEDPSQFGAEEITVVTDETKSELEEAVEEMAEDVEKIADNDAAAEKLVEATESLESFVSHLNGLADAGVQITPVALDQYLKGVRESLEARKIPSVLYADEFSAAEASFESADKEDEKSLKDKAKEMGQRAGNVLQRFWNMIKAAVGAVVTSIQNFIAGIGKSGDAVIKAGNRLKAVSKAAKGSAKGKVKGKAFAGLVVGGSVNPVEALDKVLKGYEDVKAAQAKVTGAIALAAQTLGTGKPNKTVIENSLKNAAGKMPQEFKLDLPGGNEAVYVHGKGTGLLQLFDRSVFKIAKKGDVSVPEEVEPLSPSDILALGGKLVSIGGAMKDAVTAAKESIDKAQLTLKKAESFVSAAEKEDAEGQAAAKEALKAAKACVSTAKIFVPNYMKYVGATAQLAYRFGVQSANQYKGGAGAAKEEGAGEGAGAENKEKQTETEEK